MPRLCPVALLAVAAACHVTTSAIDDLTGPRTRVPRPERARAVEPKLEVTDDGHLRVVETLTCPGDVTAVKSRYEVRTTRPSYATAILGIIAASAGGVAAAIGLGSDEPGSSPSTWLGVGGVIGGGVFAVAPFFGNGSERVLLDERTVTLDTTNAACGTRPVGDADVMMRVGALEIPARLGPDGRSDVPAFAIVDAFSLHRMPLMVVDVQVDREGGLLGFRAEIEADDMARGREGFLKAAAVDGEVGRPTGVPTLRARSFTLELAPAGRPAAIVQLDLANQGPGDAYQVRGVLQSNDPRFEGRILYVGHLPPGEARQVAMLVPLGAAPLAPGMRFYLVLRDSEESASAVPIRGTRKQPPSR